jgi:hypothetical protein
LALCADLLREERIAPAAPADADPGISARLRRKTNDVDFKTAAVAFKSTNDARSYPTGISDIAFRAPEMLLRLFYYLLLY